MTHRGSNRYLVPANRALLTFLFLRQATNADTPLLLQASFCLF
jgi:hypothetical protein